MADQSIDIDTALAASINTPKTVTVDGVTSTQHSLSELIAAHKYVKQCAGAQQQNLGLQFRRMKPPSAV